MTRRKTTFDRMVVRAMAKWPDVPECYDWLKLDRRGRWLLRGSPVMHPNVVAFIGRNYAVDRHGRWYFQNGPQRVFVVLDYTPWVFLLDGAGKLRTHTGHEVKTLSTVYVDRAGNLLLHTDAGIGILCDRDLPAFFEQAVPAADADGDLADVLAALRGGGVHAIRWLNWAAAAHAIDADDVPARFGFVSTPRPVN